MNKQLKAYLKWKKMTPNYKELYKANKEKLEGIKKRSIAPLDITSVLRRQKQIDTKTALNIINQILGDL